MQTIRQLKQLRDSWGTFARVPLRVTLELDTALAGYGALHLDSILSAAVVPLAMNGHGLPESAEPYYIPLPLAKLWQDPANGGLPLWAATDFAPQGAQHADVATWHRYSIPSRLVATDKRGRAFAPRETQGPDKLMAIPLPVETAERWEADCVGDEHIIADLLSRLSHVGKKRTQGYGAVRRWTVEPIARFDLLDGGGKLRRPIPIAALSELRPFDAVLCGWTPPYYPRVRGGMALCIPAGAPCAPELLPQVRSAK